MKPNRVDRILEDWSAVASQARRPAGAPRPVVVRSGLPAATLAGATLIVVVVLGGVWLSRQQPPVGSVGSSPPPAQQPTASPATPSATPAPTTGVCGPDSLAAHITLWEGAAGQRIAHVALTVVGPGPCEIQTMPKPQFLDGHGDILIVGSNPPGGQVLRLASGDVVTTLVQVGNYCGPTPVAPTTIGFVFANGVRIVATPVSPTDATVPPCLAGLGSAGTIEMHPWAR